ncbi:MAG TPA: PqqD family protein [Blastocatellia bacterium]|nr:PqqD family protein [Blastocatellia bacterium]
MIIRTLPEETLVYDLEQHKAHCLNDLASRIWKKCDGKTSLEQARLELEKETGCPLGSEVILYGLKTLRKAQLLEKSGNNTAIIGAIERQVISETGSKETGSGMTRRSLIGRLGLGAMLIPVISSIVTPTAQAGASCRAKGQPCGTGLPACCSGFTCNAPDIGVCV